MGINMKKLNYKNQIERLEKLLVKNHGGCIDNTCDIINSLDAGFSLWAIHLFSNCGAACKKFDKLYKTLPAKFEKEAEKERINFIETVSHSECSECNAIAWNVDAIWSCDSCGNDNEEIK